MQVELEDGIYLGLPDAAYHAQPRLSASGIKTMQESVEDFWFDSWMNPQREAKETDEMNIGKAYHTRVCEGREAFDALYCPAFNEDDYPDALSSNDDLKERLKEMGLKVGGNKQELIDRILEADPEAPIMQRFASEYGKRMAGRSFMSQDLMDKIERNAAFIEKHPTLGKAFKGGFSEISILYTEKETGVKMKSRMDKLKPQAIIDLKTFQNPAGKPIDKAIYGVMANYRYHIQAAVYYEAVDAAKELFKYGKVFGDGCKETLAKTLSHDNHVFMFVFQKTNGAPLVRARIMPRHLMIMGASRSIVKEAQEKFARYSEVYGTDGTPWLDMDAMEPQSFEDELYPSYAF